MDHHLVWMAVLLITIWVVAVSAALDVIVYALDE